MLRNWEFAIAAPALPGGIVQTSAKPCVCYSYAFTRDIKFCFCCFLAPSGRRLVLTSLTKKNPKISSTKYHYLYKGLFLRYKFHNIAYTSRPVILQCYSRLLYSVLIYHAGPNRGNTERICTIENTF